MQVEVNPNQFNYCNSFCQLLVDVYVFVDESGDLGFSGKSSRPFLLLVMP
jgi:hypothetical protein